MTQLPTIVVSCRRVECPKVDILRPVQLRFASLGVVEVPRCLLCLACGMEMAVVRSWSPDGQEENSMAKIHKDRPPTFAEDAGRLSTSEGEAFADRLDGQLVGEPGPELPEAVEGDQVERVHPGTGQPMTAVEGPADGTEHELVADPVPDGSVATVLEWVHRDGDDHTAVRATQALTVEQTRDKPRATLVAELEKLAG